MTRTWLKSGTLAVAMTIAAAPSFAQGPSRDEDPATHRSTAPTQQAAQDEQKKFAENMFMTNTAEVRYGRNGLADDGRAVRSEDASQCEPAPEAGA